MAWSYRGDLRDEVYTPTYGPTLISSGGGGSNEVQPGATTIQAALASASAGSTVRLAPGIFDLGFGYLSVPNNVNLMGAGPELSIIKSRRNCFDPPFHGIIGYGDNSVIQDLAIVAVSGTGNGNENCNPISARSAVAIPQQNVTFRNCYLFGLNDVIINTAGGIFGDMQFYNCTIEGQCDLIMWQCQKKLVMRNCHLIHTTPANWLAIGCTMLLMGDDNGSITLNDCRMTVRGSPLDNFAGIYALENGGTNSYIEANNVVMDWKPYIPPNSRDIQNFGSKMYLNNVVRADGQPLTFDLSGNAVTSAKDSLILTTVVKLPTTPAVGDTAWVTDGAAALAWGATVTAGSTAKYLVMWNGTNWTVMGK